MLVNIWNWVWEEHRLSSKEKILLIDDEEGILTLLEITLRKERFEDITRCTTGSQALSWIKTRTFDLILLDVMLPDCNGFDLCRDIRKHTETPIMFITACGTDLDKLTGLGIGGDDYITKPFNPLEVVARMKAFFRRQQISQSSVKEKASGKMYDFGTFSLNTADATLTVGGVPAECTAKELELLSFFCRNPNRLFSTQQIYEYVWGGSGYGEEKTVAMHISKIRKKLRDDPKAPEIIVNLRGLGYKFIPPAKGVRDEDQA
ncbi:response regulator transcription factor [Paenibacillus chartarius]|uniref:Response regulator transcription factor n=1 Tax=Paenibacillus chartarius TaxID=747481 RepID=A0ABV6DLG7_9BACL